MTEKTVAVFSDIPALKLGQYFTGMAAQTTAAIFPVYCRYFSGSTPLTPLFFQLETASVGNFDRR